MDHKFRFRAWIQWVWSPSESEWKLPVTINIRKQNGGGNERF